jgi:thiol-disulfide isomerase/thioredoxin
VAYYRLALDSRTHAPDYHHGTLRDDLAIEFHDFWTAQGRTETAWAAWNPPMPAKIAETEVENTAEKDKATSDKKEDAAEKKKEQESGWEQVTKKMPSFGLSDFAGKTWRQKDLQGKVVLIVSWATWCGPCHLQDKLLQKFYEKIKDRNDLVVLSFNVDENPGQVLPFIRKEGFTFPRLAAFSYDEDAKKFVPRTWIIDAHGDWRWVRNGYDESKTYAEFEKEMLDQIEKAKGKS